MDSFAEDSVSPHGEFATKEDLHTLQQDVQSVQSQLTRLSDNVATLCKSSDAQYDTVSFTEEDVAMFMILGLALILLMVIFRGIHGVLQRKNRELNALKQSLKRCSVQVCHHVPHHGVGVIPFAVPTAVDLTLSTQLHDRITFPNYLSLF